MLVPAITKKAEIQSAISSKYYTTDMFYYIGNLGSYTIEISDECKPGYYQFASVDKNGNLVGYIAYTIDFYAEQVYNFGLISFDKGNMILPADLNTVMEKLLSMPNIHRIEWRVIEGNPAVKAYDRFCNKHNGSKYTLHRSVRDENGIFHDEYIYEVLK